MLLVRFFIKCDFDCFFDLVYCGCIDLFGMSCGGVDVVFVVVDELSDLGISKFVIV